MEREGEGRWYEYCLWQLCRDMWAWRGKASCQKKQKEFQLKVSRMWKMSKTMVTEEEGEEGRSGRTRGGKEGEGKCTVEVFTTQVNSLSITISGRESLLLELS